jgi:hypothetical protein
MWDGICRCMCLSSAGRVNSGQGREREVGEVPSCEVDRDLT